MNGGEAGTPSADIRGGLLVGGASRRMGRDKALLEVAGLTMAERVAAALRPHVVELVLLGAGPVPGGLTGLRRLADAALPHRASTSPERRDTPGGAGIDAAASAGAGPLAGILAALRSDPESRWLICPCDLPRIEARAVAWLLSQDRPDAAAILPRLDPQAPPEPLFALYRPAALPLVESLAAAGVKAPRRLADEPGVHLVTVPPDLAPSWRDADTPRDLADGDSG